MKRLSAFFVLSLTALCFALTASALGYARVDGGPDNPGYFTAK